MSQQIPHASGSAPRTVAFTLLAAVFALVVGAFVGQQTATGQQAADAGKIEYNLVSIEANSLGAKLTELGNQGWEVITITTAEARVDGTNNPPKVITEKYDITCRKPARR